MNRSKLIRRICLAILALLLLLGIAEFVRAWRATDAASTMPPPAPTSAPDYTGLAPMNTAVTVRNRRTTPSQPVSEPALPDRLAVLHHMSVEGAVWKGLGVIESDPPRLIECFSYPLDELAAHTNCLECVSAAMASPLSFWETSRRCHGGNTGLVTHVEWYVTGGQQWSLDLTSNDLHSLCATNGKRDAAVLLRKDGQWHIARAVRGNPDVVRTLLAARGQAAPASADFLPMLVSSSVGLGGVNEDQLIIIRRDLPGLYGVKLVNGAAQSIAHMPLPFRPEASVLADPRGSGVNELLIVGRDQGRLRLMALSVQHDGLTGIEHRLPRDYQLGAPMTAVRHHQLMSGVPVIAVDDGNAVRVIYVSRSHAYMVQPTPEAVATERTTSASLTPGHAFATAGQESPHWLFVPFTERGENQSTALLVAVDQNGEQTTLRRPGRSANIVCAGRTILWYVRDALYHGNRRIDLVIPIDAHTLREGEPLPLGTTGGYDSPTPIFLVGEPAGERH